MTFDRWYTLSNRVYHLSVVLLVFQLFYLFAGDGCILAIIYCKSSCNLLWAGILQTLHRSLHTSIILTQFQPPLAPMGLVWELLQTTTPLRSVSRWPMAMKYCESVGMTPPPGFFRRFLESNVRQKDSIWIKPLTALEFVSISRSSGSTEVQSFVAETIASSFSGSSWKQMRVREMRG